MDNTFIQTEMYKISKYQAKLLLAKNDEQRNNYKSKISTHAKNLANKGISKNEMIKMTGGDIPDFTDELKMNGGKVMSDNEFASLLEKVKTQLNEHENKMKNFFA